MPHPLNSTPMTAGLAQARVALRLLGPKIDVTAARTAFMALEPHLPAPSLCEFMTPHSGRFSGASMFYFPQKPAFQEFPEVLFSEQRDLAPGDFPEEWVDAYLKWGQKLRLGQELELLHDQCLAATREGDSKAGLAPQHPAVAGAVLYLLNPMPSSPVRQFLKEMALETAFGAYVAAQGMLLSEEREAVIEVLKGSSRFLFWLSQTAGFQSACMRAARPHLDFWGGLTLLQADEGEDQLGRWLEDLALAACEHPAAACAALVLQPQMERSVRDLWLSTLLRKPSPRHSLATALFAKQTSADWAHLVDHLRPQATACHGPIWHNWFFLVEPNRAQDQVDANLAADPLWCVELIGKLDLKTDGLRYRMSEQHASRLWDRESAVVIEWIHARSKSRRSNGTAF